MRTHSFLVMVFATAVLASEANAQEAAPDRAERAVVLAIGDPGSESATEGLSRAAGKVAEERGLALVDPGRVTALVGVMAKPPETADELLRVGELLEAEVVVLVSATGSTNQELALLVRRVRTGAGGAVERTRIASRASAQAQVRAMVNEVLSSERPNGEAPAFAQSAAVIGAMPTATRPAEQPAEQPPEAIAPAPAPEAPVVVPPEVAPVAGPVELRAVEPQQGVPVLTGGHMAPPRPSDEELAEIPPGRQLAAPPNEGGKVAGVFGVTAGVQAGLWFVSLMTWAMILEEKGINDWDEDLSERYEEHEKYQAAANLGYIYLSVAPALSSLVGWAVGNRSRNYDCGYGAVVGGGYLGAVAGLGMTFLGFYVREPMAVAWGYVLGPILFPAVGAALGYLIGRRAQGGVIKLGRSTGGPAVALSKRVEWTLPQPVVTPSMDGSRRAYVGVSLGTVSF